MLIDTTRLKTDIAVPADADTELAVTASGDLVLVSGRSNLYVAMKRRLAAFPGSLIHQPEYGAGILSWLERTNTPGERARLATAIRRNVLRDSRVSDATVQANLGTPTDSTVPDALTVELEVTVRHDRRSENITASFQG